MGRESLTSFDKNNRVNLSVEKKKFNEAFRGVYVFKNIREKKPIYFN